MNNFLINLINNLFRKVTWLEHSVINFIIKLDIKGYKTIGICIKILFTLFLILIHIYLYLLTFCFTLCIVLQSRQWHKLFTLLKKEILFRIVIILFFNILTFYHCSLLLSIFYGVVITYILYLFINIIIQRNITFINIFLAIDKLLCKFLINIKKKISYIYNINNKQ